MPLGEGICGHVAQSGVGIRLAEVQGDVRFYGEIDRRVGRQTHSYLCVPLTVDGRLIGTAQLVNRHDGDSFSEEDQAFMEGFARQVALAIQNARRSREVVRHAG